MTLNSVASRNAASHPLRRVPRGVALMAHLHRPGADLLLALGDPAIPRIAHKLAFTDRRPTGSASDLDFHVADMFATVKSKNQRGRGRSVAGPTGPPSVVVGERGGRPWSGRLTSPGRSQKAARRTWRTLAGPVGKLQEDRQRSLIRAYRRMRPPARGDPRL